MQKEQRKLNYGDLNAVSDWSLIFVALPLFGLINDEKKLQSYITNALPQMVRALKSQKGLGMWEIINEPEGCVQPGKLSYHIPLGKASKTPPLVW